MSLGARLGGPRNIFAVSSDVTYGGRLWRTASSGASWGGLRNGVTFW